MRNTATTESIREVLTKGGSMTAQEIAREAHLRTTHVYLGLMAMEDAGELASIQDPVAPRVRIYSLRQASPQTA